MVGDNGKGPARLFETTLVRTNKVSEPCQFFWKGTHSISLHVTLNISLFKKKYDIFIIINKHTNFVIIKIYFNITIYALCINKVHVSFYS
jgi:hypothetical protein